MVTHDLQNICKNVIVSLYQRRASLMEPSKNLHDHFKLDSIIILLLIRGPLYDDSR
jgi:hypothetical protein